MLVLFTASFRPQVHLNQKLLSGKQQQLQSLLQLYENEIQWLSYGSRLWFGQIKGRRVVLLVDFSDTACFSSYNSQYLTALQVLVNEQLASMDTVHIRAIGTEIVPTNPSVLKLSNNTRFAFIDKCDIGVLYNTVFKILLKTGLLA